MANEYCTAAELEVEISAARQIEATSETAAAVDALVLSCIETVSRRIDSYLGGRITVPVTSSAVKALLRPHCITLSKRLFFVRRDLKISDALAQECKESIAWLMAVAKGDVSPPPTTPVPTVPDTVTEGSFGSETQVFTSPDTEDLDDNSER